MRSIGIVCPSRDRPERFRAFAESVMSRASSPERVNISLVLDKDDPTLTDYYNAATDVCGVMVLKCPQRMGVPRLANWGASRTPCDIIVIGSDDTLCRTKGWDDLLDDAMWSDGLGCVYFNSGDGRDRVEHFAVGKPWVDALGYLLRPEFKHFCADQWVGDIAKAVDRAKWLSGVTFEHMHAKFGKAQWDETYKSKRRDNWSAQDNLLMSEMKAEWESDRNVIADCLRSA